jgi:hypothetical protein
MKTIPEDINILCKEFTIYFNKSNPDTYKLISYKSHYLYNTGLCILAGFNSCHECIYSDDNNCMELASHYILKRSL